MLYVHTLSSTSVFIGTGNLFNVLVLLQEQRPISLKVMNTPEFYKCKKKFMLSHLDKEVC